MRIAPRDRLLAFMRPQWAYHHPLASWQLNHAGGTAVVESVEFFHGGDELYVLRGLSKDGAKGIWHEACLDAT